MIKKKQKKKDVIADIYNKLHELEQSLDSQLKYIKSNAQNIQTLYNNELEIVKYEDKQYEYIKHIGNKIENVLKIE